LSVRILLGEIPSIGTVLGATVVIILFSFYWFVAGGWAAGGWLTGGCVVGGFTFSVVVVVGPAL